MNNRKVKLGFFGGAGSVTGSNFLLESDKLKIIIDCGLFQETLDIKGKNSDPFPFNPKEIDFVFITHGHLDHIGRLPKLVKDGFQGKIFSTSETKEISRLILEDALKVMGYKKEEKNPIYSEKDLIKTFELWSTLSYEENFNLGDEIKVSLKNSGHILGSAMVEFQFKGSPGSLVFTGDLGNWPNPLLKKAEIPHDVRYLVMESVYGDRNQESAGERDKKFKEVVKKVIGNGGVLLIPSFSLERAQVILFEINKLVEKGEIPTVPVFFDSPLAIKLTEIYKNSTHLFNEEVQELIKKGDDIFSFPGLSISRKAYQSKAIYEIPGPKIIIAGSGMSQGGRIIFHEAEYLPDEKNAVLLVGYQAVGTLGRSLEEGAKEVVIEGQKVPVRAKVEHLDGFSAHKDSEALLEFVSESGEYLEKVFLAMGEPKASLFLSQRIRDYLGVSSVAPKEGDTFELDFGE